MLRPMEGVPGLFKDTVTNETLNFKDFIPYEVSKNLQGVEFDWVFNDETTRVVKAVERFLLNRWFISGYGPPTNPSALQQQVELRLNGELLAKVSVFKLYKDMSVPNVQEPGVLFNHPLWDEKASARVQVRLLEQPLEGCGARVHLSGSYRKPLTF